MDIKNNSLAKKSRNIGNEYFRKQDYYYALANYNYSLCLAPIGSESISIAYGNRSAVYIKLNQFDLCLENIQRARDSNYPADKIEKLNKREEECKELMKTQKPNPDDDPFNYFKLSYPPNPKYPQIVDCLEMHNNRVVTNRDLKTGDIIGIEDPVCVKLNDEACVYLCNLCMKDNLLNLIPCSGCAMAMFCSDKCQQNALNGFHQFKCNNQVGDIPLEFVLSQVVECIAAFDYNVKELKKFVTAHKGKNLFDFDMSNPDDPMYEKNIVLMSLLMDSTGIYCDWMHTRFCIMFADLAKRIQKLNKVSEKNQKFLSRLFQKLFFVRSGTIVNFIHSEKFERLAEFQVQVNDGFGSYLFSGMLNHSCDPNVKNVNVSNKNVYYICKPIKAGSQIYNSIATFSHVGPKAKRQESLKQVTGIDCNCTACQNDWPTIEGLRAVDPTFHYQDDNSLSPRDKAKKSIARNNAYVDKNYKENVPTQEVYMTIQKNLLELCTLARPSFYP